jgi:hypothetical protein
MRFKNLTKLLLTDLGEARALWVVLAYQPIGVSISSALA